jgi:GT2 family glycosyltransferase
VTPWLNHPELAPDYLQAVSVRNATDELIVVDNASTQPVGFARVYNFRNEGFSRACNTGLKEATADAVLFLNNDIAMTSPDWLAKLRAALEPGVLAGANIRHDRHGDVDGQPLPYLDGWCLAGMRDDLLDLGGWDEDLEEPSYYGDNLLSLRARASGMTLREVEVGLLHKLGRTSRPGEDPGVGQVTARNRVRFEEHARAILGGVPVRMSA